nr:DNA-3-methyladenine glycosylase 2 family protein [Desulfobacterales bacterium]
GEAALRGDLDLAELGRLPDEGVIRKLSALPGIGVWTAEMLLIFSLCRPDVVSWGDLAIRRGMMRLYGLKELSRPRFDRFRKRYSPYGSVASLYLWAVSAEET